MHRAAVRLREATKGSVAQSQVKQCLLWRDGRAVEGAALEKRYTLTGIEGSNPSLSAKMHCEAVRLASRAAASAKPYNQHPMQKNKTAVVTGAGQGIGKGIAEKLAKEGCNIVVADINLKEAKKTASQIGKKAIAVQCDVSEKKSVKNLFSEAKEKFGQIDILVNNAGIFPFTPFNKISEEEWDKVIDVNLKSIFLCCQEAAKLMKAGGRIVNISSIAAFIGFEILIHYCASKAGINGFTRALALELAPRKITVNGVAPGAISTPGANKTSTKESIQQTIAIIPLARMGKPEDIANAVAFLASEEASYITGQTIIVDGGYTLR
jgi:3-oxoacyl-[acyl-carrier protein] reductase